MSRDTKGSAHQQRAEGEGDRVHRHAHEPSRSGDREGEEEDGIVCRFFHFKIYLFTKGCNFIVYALVRSALHAAAAIHPSFPAPVVPEVSTETIASGTRGQVTTPPARYLPLSSFAPPPSLLLHRCYIRAVFAHCSRCYHFLLFFFHSAKAHPVPPRTPSPIHHLFLPPCIPPPHPSASRKKKRKCVAFFLQCYFAGARIQIVGRGEYRETGAWRWGGGYSSWMGGKREGCGVCGVVWYPRFRR